MDRNKLVEDNLKLVYKLATKYKYLCCSTIDFDDLVSLGFIGLVKAAKTFDESKNIKFSTLAYICIKNSILREFVAKQYKFNSNNTISLNSLIDNKCELQELIADENTDKTFDEIEYGIELNKIYECCTTREQRIIDLYLRGYTIKQIAFDIGCTIITVTRLIEGLKKYIGGDKMELADTEVVCPYCNSKLEDDINGEIHIKFCSECGKWWKTYTSNE